MCLSPQQVVLEPMVMWGKGDKVIEIPFAVGVGTWCVLEVFSQMKQGESLSQLERGQYIA